MPVNCCTAFWLVLSFEASHWALFLRQEALLSSLFPWFSLVELTWFRFLLLINRRPVFFFFFQENPEAWTSVSDEVSSFVHNFGTLCELPFSGEESSGQWQPGSGSLGSSWFASLDVEPLLYQWSAVGTGRTPIRSVCHTCIQGVGAAWRKRAPKLSATLARNLGASAWSWEDEKCWCPAPLVRCHILWSGAERRGSPVFLAIPTPHGVCQVDLGVGWVSYFRLLLFLPSFSRFSWIDISSFAVRTGDNFQRFILFCC